MLRIFRGHTAADLADENQGGTAFLAVLPDGPVYPGGCPGAGRRAPSPRIRKNIEKMLLRIFRRHTAAYLADENQREGPHF